MKFPRNVNSEAELEGVLMKLLFTLFLFAALAAPLSAQNMLQAYIDAGVPKGVVNLVMGPGDSVGDELLRAPQQERLDPRTEAVEDGGVALPLDRALRHAIEIADAGNGPVRGERPRRGRRRRR